MGIRRKGKTGKGRKREWTESKKERIYLFHFAGAKMEKIKVAMCFLVTALVEVWPKEEGDRLFSTENNPVVELGKLVNVNIFLRHCFC